MLNLGAVLHTEDKSVTFDNESRTHYALRLAWPGDQAVNILLNAEQVQRLRIDLDAWLNPTQESF